MGKGEQMLDSKKQTNKKPDIYYKRDLSSPPKCWMSWVISEGLPCNKGWPVFFYPQSLLSWLHMPAFSNLVTAIWAVSSFPLLIKPLVGTLSSLLELTVISLNVQASSYLCAFGHGGPSA